MDTLQECYIGFAQWCLMDNTILYKNYWTFFFTEINYIDSNASNFHPCLIYKNKTQKLVLSIWKYYMKSKANFCNRMYKRHFTILQKRSFIIHQQESKNRNRKVGQNFSMIYLHKKWMPIVKNNSRSSKVSLFLYYSPT